MKGNRKTLVALFYLMGVFAIGIIVAWRAPHELAIAGAYSIGAATGLGTFMWGNAQEWKAQSGVTGTADAGQKEKQ